MAFELIRGSIPSIMLQKVKDALLKSYNEKPEHIQGVMVNAIEELLWWRETARNGYNPFPQKVLTVEEKKDTIEKEETPAQDLEEEMTKKLCPTGRH